ncbi:MAG TPA: hypothetical protein VI216_02965 [Candidatus Acidoferrales bacterium]
MKVSKIVPALAVLVLGAILATLTSRPAGAQSRNNSPTGTQEAPVTIVSPLPVPVSVGNFPATQSITGTVNVANFSNQFSFRDSRRAVLLDIRQSTETIVLDLKKPIGWANGAGRRSSDIGWIGEGSTVFR